MIVVENNENVKKQPRDECMSAKHTIVINGKVYDAVSGLPTAKSVPATPTSAPTSRVVGMDISRPVAKHRTPAHNSKNIHHTTEHSTTLRRQHLQAPKSKVTTHAPVRHSTGHTYRAPVISHFAAHPQPLPKHGTNIVEAAPTAAHSKTIQPARLTSVEVKEKLIAHAGTKVTTYHHVIEQQAKPKKQKKPLRRTHLVAASFALMLLGGYLTYITMPSLSVGVAASQAGVAAKYPNFSPDGYSFDGPVAFEPGEVTLKFKSNGGSAGYTIEQRASTWNSVALLDNYVESASNGSYEITSQNGVTIYTYGNNAAWTNGGVFYTIGGEAPLDADQLLQIASSM